MVLSKNLIGIDKINQAAFMLLGKAARYAGVENDLSEEEIVQLILDIIKLALNKKDLILSNNLAKSLDYFLIPQTFFGNIKKSKF